MTGIELTAVWLFTIFCAAVTVASVAKSWSASRVEVAKQNAQAHVEGFRVVAQAQHGQLTVPPAWMTEGDR